MLHTFIVSLSFAAAIFLRHLSECLLTSPYGRRSFLMLLHYSAYHGHAKIVAHLSEAWYSFESLFSLRLREAAAGALQILILL